MVIHALMPRIQATPPRMQPRQPQQRIGERRGHLRQLPQLAHRGHQRVQFHRLAGLHVLRHGGLERAQLARDLVAVFGLLGNRQADARTDLARLQHHVADKAARQFVVQNQVGRGARHGTHGVDRHVAPQLVPDVFLDLRRARPRQTPHASADRPARSGAAFHTAPARPRSGRCRCGGESRPARPPSNWRAPHRRSPAPPVWRAQWRRQGRPIPAHAPPARRQSPAETTTAHRSGRQHDGLRPQQRPNGARHIHHARRLDEHHHHILHTQIGRLVMQAHGDRAVSRSPSRERRPCVRSACSAAPRATTPTSQPAAARRAPIQPPMAPAP